MADMRIKPVHPNIFIYISDDQNQWDYGAMEIQKYQRLGLIGLQGGIKFNNAYTSQAICSPVDHSYLPVYTY